jgi:membrane-associated phospholipid phosphatase
MKTQTNAMWLAAALFALLAAAGLLGGDLAVARWIATVRPPPWWGQGTAWLDLIALKEVSNFLLGALLVVAAGGLVAIRRTRRIGWPLLYLGLVQFLSTTIADLAKPQFGRLRPFEALEGSSGADLWFVGANAFPSGHAAFYAGLFFPLMLLLPRWSALWVLPPAFIAVARVVGNDHYLSDVCASLALAAALAAALSPLAAKGGGEPQR